MVHGIPNISIHPAGYFAARGGKMSLPVDASSLIYSHFEHVSGIAAPAGTRGVAISKLHLLDVLIGNLNQIKRGAPSGPEGRNEALPGGQLDALIEGFRDRLIETKAAGDAMPYIPSPSVQSGALFNIAV